MSTAAAVFDGMAGGYDAGFTDTSLGRICRQAVWRRLDARFAAGARVLELGCGTGEDAVHLARRGVQVLATDGAPAMVDAARRKAREHGMADRIAFGEMTLESFAAGSSVEAASLDEHGPFDGAFSNFGALNCVTEMGSVARALAARLGPGAPVVLTLMGPLCPWEWLWFLAHGQPGRAFRRLRPGGARWRGVTVRYPGIRAARKAFAPWFRPLRVSSVGALVPPPYAEAWARRHGRLVARLNGWERRMEARFPLPWLADHYVLELERR
ncbi:MAG TPA: methyltransferase domain-containing protein [Longimicrobium sp.]|nr:methyltransferase domain-containing protein [Longimicrobium sp.]